MGVRNFCNQHGHDGIVAQFVDYGYTVETRRIGTVGPVGPRFEQVALRQSHVYTSGGVLIMVVTERCLGSADLSGYGDYFLDIRVDIDTP